MNVDLINYIREAFIKAGGLKPLPSVVKKISTFDDLFTHAVSFLDEASKRALCKTFKAGRVAVENQDFYLKILVQAGIEIIPEITRAQHMIGLADQNNIPILFHYANELYEDKEKSIEKLKKADALLAKLLSLEKPPEHHQIFVKAKLLRAEIQFTLKTISGSDIYLLLNSVFDDERAYLVDRVKARYKIAFLQITGMFDSMPINEVGKIIYESLNSPYLDSYSKIEAKYFYARLLQDGFIENIYNVDPKQLFKEIFFSSITFSQDEKNKEHERNNALTDLYVLFRNKFIDQDLLTYEAALEILEDLETKSFDIMPSSKVFIKFCIAEILSEKIPNPQYERAALLYQELIQINGVHNEYQLDSKVNLAILRVEEKTNLILDAKAIEYLEEAILSKDIRIKIKASYRLAELLRINGPYQDLQRAASLYSSILSYINFEENVPSVMKLADLVAYSDCDTNFDRLLNHLNRIIDANISESLNAKFLKAKILYKFQELSCFSIFNEIVEDPLSDPVYVIKSKLHLAWLRQVNNIYQITDDQAIQLLEDVISFPLMGVETLISAKLSLGILLNRVNNHLRASALFEEVIAHPNSPENEVLVAKLHLAILKVQNKTDKISDQVAENYLQDVRNKRMGKEKSLAIYHLALMGYESRSLDVSDFGLNLFYDLARLPDAPKDLKNNAKLYLAKIWIEQRKRISFEERMISDLKNVIDDYYADVAVQEECKGYLAQILYKKGENSEAYRLFDDVGSKLIATKKTRDIAKLHIAKMQLEKKISLDDRYATRLLTDLIQNGEEFIRKEAFLILAKMRVENRTYRIDDEVAFTILDNALNNPQFDKKEILLRQVKMRINNRTEQITHYKALSILKELLVRQLSLSLAIICFYYTLRIIPSYIASVVIKTINAQFARCFSDIEFT